MQIVIDIPDASIKDYQDLYYKIHSMAASEGLFDDKKKSQRALALKVVLDVLGGVVNGTPLPKGHGRLTDLDVLMNFTYNTYGINSGKCMTKDNKDIIDYIYNKAEIIIEADKAESEE